MLSFKKIYDYFLSFIFTKRCRYCREVCAITDEVCKSCADEVYRIEGEICRSCGCSKHSCECKGKSNYYESVCAPYYYEGAPKKAIIELKHRKDYEIIESMGRDMAKCVELRYKNLDFDYCTYVPMHKSDEKKRGYNQAQLLAEVISRELSIPCVSLLEKSFKTPSQHQLSQMKRSGNLAGVFNKNEKCTVNTNGTRVLLCDDIKTTGATLNECTKAILFTGAAEVRCVASCIARKKSCKKEKNKK